MRKYLTCFLILMVAWQTTATADDLYQKMTSPEQMTTSGEYALASNDKRAMLTFDGSKISQMPTGTTWIGSDDGIVIPYDEKQQPALLGLIEAGDYYVIYFRGTETCLAASGTKNSPKLTTLAYSEDMAEDNRALWKIELNGDELTLRSVQVGYCLIYGNNTFKVADKNSKNQYVNIYQKIGEGVRIPSSGYLSYVTLTAVDFTQTPGLTACEVVAATKSRVNIVPIEQAPAFTAVVLHAAKGSYAISKAAGTVAPLTSNILRASDGSMSHRADGKNYYVLDYRLAHGVGFYRMDKDDIVAERTGYLIIRGDDSDADFIPLVDGPPTGIEELGRPYLQPNRTRRYDMMGRPLSDGLASPGIVIVGNKKVVGRP